MKRLGLCVCVVAGVLSVRLATGGELPRAEIDFAETKVHEEHREQWEDLAPIAVRDGSGYVVYACRSRRVRFAGRRLGAAEPGAQLTVRALAGSFVQTLPEPGGTTAEFAFEAPAAGWYRISPGSKGAFLLERADAAVAIDVSRGPVSLELPKGTATCWFDLPNRRCPFALGVDGEDVAAKFVDYSNAVRFDRTGLTGRRTLCVARGAAGGAGELTLSAAKGFTLDVTGVPGYLQLTVDKRAHWNGVHRDPAKRIAPIGRGTSARDVAGETAALRCGGRNPAFVAKVASGEFRRARVSWWGFDPEDSTRFVQEAIDSPADEIVVDRLGSEWVVSPLFIRRDNLTVTFEDGATLLARRGAFIPLSDRLLTVTEATNVTLRGHGVLRMRQAEYVKPPYIKGEWRHCLDFTYVRGIVVDGLRCELSGGDGICTGNCVEDIVIRNCVCDRNFRQGISICGAKDLLIEDCELINTAGTAPAAGIDFEPDHPTLERINNCVMRNCISTNNAGAGVDVCLNQLDATSLPVSLRIENCRFENNSSGTTVRYRRTSNCATGSVVFSRCSFVREKGCGIGIERKSADAFKLVFDRCKVLDCCAAGGKSDISFFPTKWSERIADGIEFRDLAIRQTKARPWMAANDVNFADRPTAITGRVFVKGPDGSVTTNVLDAALLARAFPSDGEKPYPRYELDYREVKVVDNAPGEAVALAPLSFQSRFCLDFYVARPGKVTFRMRQRPAAPQFEVKDMLGYVHYRFGHFCVPVRLPGAEEGEVTFEVPNAGWFLLWVNPSYLSPVQILSSACPCAVNMCEGQLMLRGVGDDVTFWLDGAPQRYPISLLVSGLNGGPASFALADSSGQAVAALDPLPDRLTPVVVRNGLREGLSPVRMTFGAGHRHHSFLFDLTGMPAYIFLSKEKFWQWSGVHRDPKKRIPAAK